MKFSAKVFTVFMVLVSCCFSCDPGSAGESSQHDMKFNQLATSWDEAIPLGNGMLGSLVWKKGDGLRLSLDRADLWDLRPMENLMGKEFSYEWVYEQWKNKTYHLVQQRFDHPYDNDPAPSKIPAAALEFNIKNWGDADSIRLLIKDAVCEVYWNNGVKLQTFVHADKPIGWFRFENVEEELLPVLIPPAYNLKGEDNIDSPVSGQDLRRLGYPEGKVTVDESHIVYEQEGWGEFKYLVDVTWGKKGDVLEGCWSISSSYPDWETSPSANDVVASQMAIGYQKSFQEHRSWWSAFGNYY